LGGRFQLIENQQKRFAILSLVMAADVFSYTITVEFWRGKPRAKA